MRRAAALARFSWELVAGDDWLVAVGVVAALCLTAAVAHDHVSAWWLMPVAVVGLLALSIRRAARRLRAPHTSRSSRSG